MYYSKKEVIKKIVQNIRNNPSHSLLRAGKFAEFKFLKGLGSSYAYNMPHRVVIELTNMCNLSCIWCFWQHKDSSERGNMDFALFKRILPQLRGIAKIQFSGGGEPLLYPKIGEVVSLSKEVVQKVEITTNGMLLNQPMAQKLAQANLDLLWVSIDGGDEKTYREIRKKSLTDLIEKIRYYSSIAKGQINVSTVVSRLNCHSLPQLPEVLKDIQNLGLLSFQPLISYEDLNAEDMRLSKEEFFTLQRKVLEQCRKFSIQTNIDSLKAESFCEGVNEDLAQWRCPNPFYGQIYIALDGSLHPCCRWRKDSHLDLRVDSFSSLWNGSSLRALRSQILQLKYPDYCHKKCGEGKY